MYRYLLYIHVKTGQTGLYKTYWQPIVLAIPSRLRQYLFMSYSKPFAQLLKHFSAILSVTSEILNLYLKSLTFHLIQNLHIIYNLALKPQNIIP